MPSHPIEHLLTIADVAKIIGMSTRTISRLIQCGHIQCYRVSNRIRISHRQLNLFLESKVSGRNQKMIDHVGPSDTMPVKHRPLKTEYLNDSSVESNFERILRLCQ